MSLRFKLPLFTAFFVIVTSCAVLTVSIKQYYEKRSNDIAMLNILLKKNVPIQQLVEIRTTQIKEETSEIIRERIFFSVILIAICVIVIFVFAGKITKPINQLVRLAEEISKGKKNFAERIHITSRDEIGKLSSSFNTLIGYVEKSLAQSELVAEKYRELIDNANSAIVRINKNGLLLFFNEYAQKLFGYLPHTIIGKPLEENIGKFRGEYTVNMLDIIKNVTYVEMEHRAENGRYLWVGWTIRPIVDGDGNTSEYLCVGSDISERKKAEKYAAIEQRKLLQTDKMATLGIMAAGIAHEINNPNNFILLNSQNLAGFWTEIEPVLDERARFDPDYAISGIPYTEMKDNLSILIQGISDGSRRIKRIVDTMKDFARTDSGIMEEFVDVCKVIDAAQLISNNLIKKSTRKFSIQCTGKIPPVLGNFQLLEQVVINLITNACQATDSLEKPIDIVAMYHELSKVVVITVSDKGKGILPENLKNIFNPFFTTKRESGGTGLGLAIAYSIVKDHGGELKIESEPDKGTIASLMLPAA